MDCCESCGGSRCIPGRCQQVGNFPLEAPDGKPPPQVRYLERREAQDRLDRLLRSS